MRGSKTWAMASVATCDDHDPACAQIVVRQPPRQSVDDNGLDLVLGTFNVTIVKATINTAQQRLNALRPASARRPERKLQ